MPTCFKKLASQFGNHLRRHCHNFVTGAVKGRWAHGASKGLEFEGDQLELANSSTCMVSDFESQPQALIQTLSHRGLTF
jgi:hypothetical protein